MAMSHQMLARYCVAVLLAFLGGDFESRDRRVQVNFDLAILRAGAEDAVVESILRILVGELQEVVLEMAVRVVDDGVLGDAVGLQAVGFGVASLLLGGGQRLGVLQVVEAHGGNLDEDLVATKCHASKAAASSSPIMKRRSWSWSAMW